jgi:hypothetical protein
MNELYLIAGFFFAIYLGCEWVLSKMPVDDRLGDDSDREAR